MSVGELIEKLESFAKEADICVSGKEGYLHPIHDVKLMLAQDGSGTICIQANHSEGFMNCSGEFVVHDDTR
ncbi:MAG: hypothetical protein DRQ48_00970 [Gammaproteobacteria bacterium]|nr:MAG: hypothetical protein DRQ44_00400 [Gammaproteobacteria bacterium]RKZ72251.1 MAG: hypothetical protein DRQ48_00970 [Gammaproteobacteria bacterium]